MPELFMQLESAILERDPERKCQLASELYQACRQGQLKPRPESEILPFDDPGQPPRPLLVDPRELQRRSSASAEGRIRLLHAFAHIEFNAINIALDVVYRFRHMPHQFELDWLRVASEEARHFRLLRDELELRGSFYGAFPAHRGLWDMVCKTRHDLLHRLALVPRVMEARGLDVTPGLISRFEQAGDHRAVEILEIIYRDEIGHVRIGNDWYRRQCAHQGLDPGPTFVELVQVYMPGKLRGPFNRPGRLAAGFLAEEIDSLEREMA